MDFIVFSHLRWNFVFQRPQHLLTRCARKNRVFFWEEPVFDTQAACLELRDISPSLKVAVPHLPAGLQTEEICKIQEWLLHEFVRQQTIADAVLWYYTPLALAFSRLLQSRAVVYDCMDELSAFRGASPQLRVAEAELFRRADLVFTGGRSLFESKRRQHGSVYCFPSSIDREFFSTARRIRTEAEDQASIPHPRLGFCGVIDERMDTGLLASIAERRPNWQIVMLGPVVKISDAELPKRANIHYLGSKDYAALPLYFAGWDVGLLPFARNEATRYISPTKTPEYLAAGLPAVSTPIKDVVDPYGSRSLVQIAETPAEFIAAIAGAIASHHSPTRLLRVDEFLRRMSWDQTWERMNELVLQVVSRESEPSSDAVALTIGTTAAD